MKLAKGVAAIAMVTSTGGAQLNPELPHPNRTFAVWTAVAPNQPLLTSMGTTHNRDLYLMGVRTRWILSQSGRIELAYAFDVVPIAVSTGMPTHAEHTNEPPACPTDPCFVPAAMSHEATLHTAYGAGAVPIGIELRLHTARSLILLARGSAGLLYFSRPVPVSAVEKRLNFMIDLGGVAEVRLTQGISVTAGYRLNHISNGGRGNGNPGMDSRMIELGLIWAH